MGETAAPGGAAEFAGSLARTSDAEVRLFHVVAQATADPLELSHAQRSLDRTASRLRWLKGRIRVSTAITAGDAEEEIARHARLMGADLVIVTIGSDDAAAEARAQRLASSTGVAVLAWVEDRSCLPAS